MFAVRSPSGVRSGIRLAASMPLPFLACLPSGELRKFAHPETFNSYVAGWPRVEFLIVFPSKFEAQITPLDAPF